MEKNEFLRNSDVGAFLGALPSDRSDVSTKAIPRVRRAVASIGAGR